MENELLERDEIVEEATDVAEPEVEAEAPVEESVEEIPAEESVEAPVEESVEETVEVAEETAEETAEEAEPELVIAPDETVEVAEVEEKLPEKEDAEDDKFELLPEKKKTLKDRLNSISLLLLLVAFAIPVAIIAYILITFFLM